GCDQVAERGGFNWKTIDDNPERFERIVYSARDCSRCAEITRFARAFLAKHSMWRRRRMMDDLDRRHLVRRGQEIIHETLGEKLAVGVIGKLLVERSTDAMRDAAHGHAA